MDEVVQQTRSPKVFDIKQCSFVFSLVAGCFQGINRYTLLPSQSLHFLEYLKIENIYILLMAVDGN